MKLNLLGIAKMATVLGSSTVTFVIAAFILFASKAKALDSCEKWRGVLFPPIGTACVDRVVIKTGKADWPNGRRSNTITYSTPNMYWIISYVSPSIIETSASQSNASVQIIPGNELSNIKITNDNLYKQSSESLGQLKTEAKFPVNGVPVDIQGMISNLEKQVNDIHSRQQYLSQISTNVGKVILRAEAWGRCKASFLGKCVDGTGGWYEGYVDVTRIFVGDIAALEKKFASDFKITRQKVLELSGSGSTNPSGSGPTSNLSVCSPTYDPRPYRPGTSGWTGRVGRIAFNNGTNSPVTVTLYHPDAPNRAFKSWTVQPGKNLFLGEDNYGMEWGIQADSSPICIVGKVSAWTQFSGQFIFQSGFPFREHN